MSNHRIESNDGFVLHSWPNKPKRKVVTTKEVERVRTDHSNHSVKELARVLGCSVSTVYTRLKEIRDENDN